ncbi:hypothetical protein PZ938_01535 [Luteipulveratus sp. YIM 133132]|uniref:Uncharacterized protein n=1 Tax=Luteipulveratus flavus TaxID=3031728 RepID=A0ABT6CC84_9MICO|nr:MULTISPECIES: hypothetical protein [unclassified Luteipulveratus]MDE9364276.1 hypothetical protein [Luteipulveratus sp. YIM 133132]MDF8266520.1 hypothetical protein [Luteipulveratus sp. YIM 133296]
MPLLESHLPQALFHSAARPVTSSASALRPRRHDLGRRPASSALTALVGSMTQRELIIQLKHVEDQRRLTPLPAPTDELQRQRNLRRWEKQVIAELRQRRDAEAESGEESDLPMPAA